MKLSSLRRRWPEAALITVLAIAAVFTGLAWRSVAIASIGGVAVFAVRRRVGDLFRGAGITVGILVVTLVVTFTIDLGYVFGGVIKRYAEAEGSKFLERPLHLGRLGIQIARGRFVVEDVRIDGLEKSDAPFFAAKTIKVDFPWWQVFSTREFLIRSVEMTDWTMQVEKFRQGNSMPNLKRKTKTPPGPKRFTTTLRYLHAYRGQFTFVDHGTWTTVARNLDISVRRATGEYLGTATITDGRVRIRAYEPMRADMRVKFRVDGSLLRLPEIDLYTDGAYSRVTGEVDFGRPWPQMIYHVDSRVDLWRMREIFFGNESWRSHGEARFTGDFHLFPGGHELKGDFTSGVAYVNAFAFPDLRGSLVWEPHRFEVTKASARFYDGAASFRYRIAPMSAPTPAVARFDLTYRRRRSRAALRRDRDARPAAARHGHRRQRPRVAARRVLAAPRRRPHGHRAAGRPVAAAARGRSRRGGDSRAGAGVRSRTEPEPVSPCRPPSAASSSTASLPSGSRSRRVIWPPNAPTSSSRAAPRSASDPSFRSTRAAPTGRRAIV